MTKTALLKILRRGVVAKRSRIPGWMSLQIPGKMGREVYESTSRMYRADKGAMNHVMDVLADIIEVNLDWFDASGRGL